MKQLENVRLSRMGALAFMLPFAVTASEITFTGADTSNPTNLSSAANWSAPPSADTIGVITASADGYVVNADLSLKGLRIESAGTKFTLGGSATLTLGEEGLTSDASDQLFLVCPMATAADQTWDFSEGASLHTYSSISGTAALCISNFFQYVYHHSTVGYDGPITYCRTAKSAENKWVEYRGDGKWANAVHIANAMPLNLRPGSNKDVQWTSIFPVSAPTVANSSAYIGLNVANETTKGTVIFGEGADLSFATDATTPYHLTLAGVFRQTGGSIVKRGMYFVTLGHMAHDASWSWEKPSLYSMEGGLLHASSILVGYKYQGATPDGCRFVQKGGTVKLPYNNDHGANLQIGGGLSEHYSIAEYRMESGTLNLTGYGISYNLALASPRASNTTMPASGFIMSGGTVTSHCLTFGSDLIFWNEKLPVLKNAFALLDLSGGTLTLNSYFSNTGASIHFSDSWNGDPAATNCFYAVKLHGGALNLTKQTEWPLQTCIPDTGAGTVLGGADRDLVITAPVHGSGIIRKEGAGGLFLSDATRFTGTLDVRGGVLSVEGNPAGDVGAEDAGCFRWTADSLAATHAEGDPVASWTDSNNGLVATTNGNIAVEWSTFKAPVFKPDAYNGHAALTFTRSSLAVPQEMNPLYGKKSCSVVAVFKTDSKGTYPTVAYSSSILSLFPGSTHSLLSVGLVNDPTDTSTGARFSVYRRFGGTKDASTASISSREGVTLFDGEIHAVALTIDEDRVMFTVDADRTVTNYTGTADVAPFGYEHANYGKMLRAQLSIGGHIIASGPSSSQFSGSAPFKGDLMEIRVYTNRLFTAAEQRTITKNLLRKYDGTTSRMVKLESGANSSGMGVPGGFTSWTPPAPVAADASWDADSVAGEDGAEVSAWTSEDGSRAATVGVSGKSAPKLVKNAINGHAALRFSADGNTALGLAAEDSPVTDADDFTVAVVWRSRDEGKSTAGNSLLHENTAAALLSTRQKTAKSADFSLTYRPGSAVMAGYGHATADQSIRTRKPYRLNDGEPHISVLSFSGTGKTYKLMTDGMVFSGSLDNVSARGAFDVLFGAYRSDLSTEQNHFDGDIAAVKMYGSALTESEMRGLSEHWAEKYAMHLLASHPYAAGTVRETGLSATNVTVAADAVLSLPLTDETPFTLGNGATLSGAGRFTGSYRFSAGSVFDLSVTSPEMFDDLQMSGGTVLIDRDGLDGGNGIARIRRLKASGSNTVQIEGISELPKKAVLFTFEEAEADEAATWTVTGAGTTLTTVRVDGEAGCVLLETRRGTVISVR